MSRIERPKRPEKPSLWLESEEGGLPLLMRLSLSLVTLAIAALAIAEVLR
jgi:hypothetical protein